MTAPATTSLEQVVLRGPLRNGLLPHSQLTVLLREDQGKPMYRTATEAVSILETSFFRDLCPFEALKNIILPALIQQHAADRCVRIWCAACSTGQEAYSLAILLEEEFPQLAGWDVTILGTDLSGTALDRARSGRYRRVEVNRGLPARLLLKYFERRGDEWIVTERLRRRCEFRKEDLRELQPRGSDFDLVLLRNVLLYLPPEQRNPLLTKVRRQMKPRGYLLLGNAEQAEDSSELFEAQLAGQCYFYQPAAERRS
jgi:chemotaxis protein methyltransferase CheR